MSPSTRVTEPELSAIPGSYYDRIQEARWHQDRAEWEAADAIYQRLVDRLARLPERRRPAGSEMQAYLIAAGTGLAVTRATLGDFAAAEQLCKNLQAWDAENADAWSRFIFKLQLGLGHVEEGLAGLQRLAEAQPGDFEAWMTLAGEAIAAQRSDLAEQAIERLATLTLAGMDDLSRAGVHLTRYDLLRMQSRWQEAGAEWDKALALAPEVAEMQEAVLRMFLAAELWDDAQRYLGGALGGPVTNYYEGYLAYRRGDKVRARALWRRVVQADERAGDSSIGPQAMAWCYLGEPREAITLLLHEVSTDRAVKGRVAMILALAWAMDGNLDAARANLGIAARIMGEPPDDKLARFDWFDFDQLVQDEAVKAALRPYFLAEALEESEE
jgi:tetratricopeptide (TPR) repeat protein